MLLFSILCLYMLKCVCMLQIIGQTSCIGYIKPTCQSGKISTVSLLLKRSFFVFFFFTLKPIKDYPPPKKKQCHSHSEQCNLYFYAFNKSTLSLLFKNVFVNKVEGEVESSITVHYCWFLDWINFCIKKSELKHCALIW